MYLQFNSDILQNTSKRVTYPTKRGKRSSKEGVTIKTMKPSRGCESVEFESFKVHSNFT